MGHGSCHQLPAAAQSKRHVVVTLLLAVSTLSDQAQAVPSHEATKTPCAMTLGMFFSGSLNPEATCHVPVQGSPLQLGEAGGKPAPTSSQLVSGKHPVAGSWTLSMSQHPATGSFAFTSLNALPCPQAARTATALSSSA